MFSEVFVTHKKFDIKAHSPLFYYRSPILLYHKKTKTATLFYQNCGFYLAELLASFAERFIAQGVALLALLPPAVLAALTICFANYSFGCAHGEAATRKASLPLALRAVGFSPSRTAKCFFICSNLPFSAIKKPPYWVAFGYESLSRW